MGTITKVTQFDVISLPPNDVEKFKEHIDTFAFLSDVKIDSKTHRISYIRAFFDTDINIENLIKEFSGVKYVDITGIDLMEW